MKPSKHKMTVLSQIFKLIPRNLIPKIANEFGIDKPSRVFRPTSHVLALVFGELTHALGLNDICDTLRNHCGLGSRIRDCVSPSRNGLSRANRNRNAEMAGKLFREVLVLLWGQQLPQFVCEALRNRHIYQDSLVSSNATKRKNWEWVISENNPCKLKQEGKNDNFKEAWDGSGLEKQNSMYYYKPEQINAY